MTMGDRIAVMNNGKLEQVGTPDEIYNRPASLFVAGFIGAPPMNLIDGELHDGRFISGQLSVPINAAHTGAAVLGIRPQHMQIFHEPVKAATPLNVFAIEHLGRESVVILEFAGTAQKIRALVEPGFGTRIGATLYARPQPEHCLLFRTPSEGANRLF